MDPCTEVHEKQNCNDAQSQTANDIDLYSNRPKNKLNILIWCLKPLYEAIKNSFISAAFPTND